MPLKSSRRTCSFGTSASIASTCLWRITLAALEVKGVKGALRNWQRPSTVISFKIGLELSERETSFCSPLSSPRALADPAKREGQ